MCGIAGVLMAGPAGEYELGATVRRMTDRLVHRGPDDSGVWVDPQAGVGLGSRRLAIVDLSPAGHQPMSSSCGRYVIAYNGEVYNFEELRRDLEPQGRKFHGHSDTEAILEAVSEWGLERAVEKFVGMFALAIWDRQERTLHLVRDRLGIKPLYYGWAGKALVFGSELKALRAHPEFASEVHRPALAAQLVYKYIPHPWSIHPHAFKLPPGCRLAIKAESFPASGPADATPYWSALEASARGVADPFGGSEEEARTELDTLLRDAVRRRLIADVPLGAFLSGGIDSSTVVALMQAESSSPVKTFTIGFHEEAFNEAPYAKAVATHLGTEHTELYLTPQETLEVIPKLPELFDEPFSDSSQIPTYLVSALARRHVTVSLSGDGGDELFGGYERYFLTRSVWSKLKWLPRFVRRLLGRGLKSVEVETYNRLKLLALLSVRYGRPGSIGDKFYKLAEVLPAPSADELYRLFLSDWKKPVNFVIGAPEGAAALTEDAGRRNLPDLRRRMMALDLETYLPEDILTKVDRASMGVSLEARVPLLDHRVVEFSARIPLSMKMRHRRGKWLLRQVLGRYVPEKLIERPKMGFAAPIDRWLRGPLRDWAEDLLSEQRLTREGFFLPKLIRGVWAEHLAERRNRADFLWNVLMFQAWQEAQR
jgi:asparagine synthase (glutamine-hydrolysing)